jgi:hypothetical protein
MAVRALFARNGRKIHLFLAWAGGIALLIFGLSGITHPIMSWTGPEQAKFFPPQLSATPVAGIGPIEALEVSGIRSASDVRLVPSFDGPVLQVLEGAGQKRRYFSLSDGQELADRDREHAIWLARYYTGLDKAPVAKVTFQTTFDDDYPWVNRLLPVWRIEFDTPDQRRAFIYTELNALAAQHNGTREWLQATFQALHTWSWLDATGNGRVILIGVLMLSLIGMSATGLAMILTFKSRAIIDAQRRWHRRLAYIVWLPIFMFSFSGAYHLLQSHYAENTRGMRVGAPMDLGVVLTAPADVWGRAQGERAANAVSLVQGPEGLLLRVERPAQSQAPVRSPDAHDEHAQHAPVTREQRFTGTPSRGMIEYVNVATGSAWQGSDRDVAVYFAQSLGGANKDEIAAVEEITRFGLGYDFRNKRLPVWQVSLNDDAGRTLFVDTGANLLVDQVSRLEYYETVSFSLLHKWNFLRPLGSKVMDSIVVGAVLLGCFATVLGMIMLVRSRRQSKRKAASRSAVAA